MRKSKRPGSREKKKPKLQGRAKKADARRVSKHPLFGPIPLVEKSWRDLEGNEHTYWSWDRDYRPPLPPGAVRGDISKQDFCESCHVPRYFFVDQAKVCVQCGRDFVFSAGEQKYWYETLGFHFDSTAIRCVRCRQRRRSRRATQQRLQMALDALAEKPDDPTHLLDVAEATIRHREKLGGGDLDRVIHAARRAIDSWPAAHDALFWQGRAHQLAGREEKGRALIERFLELARCSKKKRIRRLVSEAESRLSAKP